MTRCAGLVAFFAVLLLADWLGYAVSMALFRIAPETVPDGLTIVLPPVADTRYVPVSWRSREEAISRRGLQSYRLPESAGSMPGPKTSFTFAVLEDDGVRQIVQVDATGLLRARSRYEAHADRAVPVAYKSAAWEYERQRSWVPLVLTLLLAILAAVGAVYCVGRLSRRSASAG